MYYRELWYERDRALLLVPPLLMTALLTAARVLKRDVPAPPVFFLLLYLAGALASDLNHSTQWAYSNCFMPIATFGSLYAAITFASLTHDVMPTPRVRQAASIALAAAMLVQLVALLYNPRKQVPSRRDWEALASLKETLDAQPGPVFMPAHPLYSYLRDGTVHVHQMGLGDVEFAGGLNDLDARLASGEFPTVVVDKPMWIAGLDRYYDSTQTFTYIRGALYSRTGFGVRPESIWRYRGLLPGMP
jgi:hypothetical protein